MADIKLIEIREDEQKIIDICKNAQERLSREEGIDANPSEGLATASYVYLREMINVVNAGKSEAGGNEFDLMNLLVFGTTYRENEEAEKDGNFTPYVKPGAQFELLINEGKVIETPEVTEAQLKVGTIALKVLKNERGINAHSEETVVKMVRAFLIELLIHLNENRSKEEVQEINLMQLLDVGVGYEAGEGEEEGKFVAFARPGQEYKLLVKDDDITEE